MTYTIHITSISEQPQPSLSHLPFNKFLCRYTDQTEEPITYLQDLISQTACSVIIDYITVSNEIGVALYDKHPD